MRLPKIKIEKRRGGASLLLLGYDMLLLCFLYWEFKEGLPYYMLIPQVIMYLGLMGRLDDLIGKLGRGE